MSVDSSAQPDGDAEGYDFQFPEPDGTDAEALFDFADGGSTDDVEHGFLDLFDDIADG